MQGKETNIVSVTTYYIPEGAHNQHHNQLDCARRKSPPGLIHDKVDIHAHIHADSEQGNQNKHTRRRQRQIPSLLGARGEDLAALRLYCRDLRLGNSYDADRLLASRPLTHYTPCCDGS